MGHRAASVAHLEQRKEPAVGMIVVGVDGSEGAKAALRFALAEAKLRKAKVRAVHAWLVDATGFDGLFPALVGELGILRRAAEAALDAALRELADEGSGLEIERHVVQGIPAAVLVEQSRDAELLVVGSRGRGGFAALLLGSVSQQCAHHASCPLVIVHGRKE
jgi:nucleotide-binding universal stress UspA family protein